MTKLFGIDYAWHSTTPVACFKKSGVHFVGRYLWPSDSKGITSSEYQELKAGDIQVISFFESSSGRSLQGRSAGQSDAYEAANEIHKTGGPSNAVVYFTEDFDSSPNPSATDPYMDGAASILGKSRVGKYGGYWGVRHHLSRGYHYAVQTYAWSGGLWDPRAQVRQYSNGHTFCGVNVDYLESQVPDYGQWGYVAPAPPRPSPPPPARRPVWTASHAQWVQVLDFIRNHPGEFPNPAAAWTDMTKHKSKAAALWTKHFSK